MKADGLSITKQSFDDCGGMFSLSLFLDGCQSC
jgi:hypothetical protein